MDPAMCECLVDDSSGVSRLGEEYGCGCLEWWARVIGFLLRYSVLWIFFFDFFLIQCVSLLSA